MSSEKSRTRYVTCDISDPESEEIIISVKANFKLDLLPRYELAVQRIITKIKGNEDYFLSPVLLASDVDASVLEELPSRIRGYRVNCTVMSGALYITGLSTGPPHAGGVGAFNQQARNWNTRNRFDIFSDAVSKFGDEAAGAPDMVITVPEKYTPAGAGSRRTVGKIYQYTIFLLMVDNDVLVDMPYLFPVVIELEISNRTISQMRKDYLKYFEDDALLGVVGIKFFGTGKWSTSAYTLCCILIFLLNTFTLLSQPPALCCRVLRFSGHALPTELFTLPR